MDAVQTIRKRLQTVSRRSLAAAKLLVEPIPETDERAAAILESMKRFWRAIEDVHVAIADARNPGWRTKPPGALDRSDELRRAAKPIYDRDGNELQLPF
jgi:hypothetical protein